MTYTLLYDGRIVGGHGNITTMCVYSDHALWHGNMPFAMAPCRYMNVGRTMRAIWEDRPL